MGVVYKARQDSFGREVALKMILASQWGASPDQVARFRREASTVARMDHPNIVPVYEVEEWRGMPFFTMKLIEGQSLRQTLEEPKGDPKAAARLVETVARAVHHAHLAGIIHRDLKPENILLDNNGNPHVTDFGLAKPIDGQGDATPSACWGTPYYMAPEQVNGGRLTLAVDVWALGAILYELLTGAKPFNGDNLGHVLLQVTKDEPKSPRALNPKVGRDLEAICLKCLNKEPDKRYESAKALADDLKRFLGSETVEARPTPVWERAWKWGRRNPLAAALLLCTLALAVAVGIFVEQSNRAEQQRRDHALEMALLKGLNGDLVAAEQAIAEAELRGASTGDVRLARGQIAYFRGDLPTAIKHLEQAVKLQPRRVAPGALLAAIYMDFGFAERALELLDTLRELTPDTSEDFLFLGYAVSFMNPEEGFALMAEGINRHDSLVAHALRARAQAMVILMTGKSSDLQQARDDARTAKNMMKGNPFALSQSAFVELVAAGLLKQPGKEMERKKVLDNAWKEDVEKLDPGSHGPLAASVRICYFREVHNRDAAWAEAEWLEANAVNENTFVSALVALELYERGQDGDFKRALDVLARGGDSITTQLCRCYIQAELPEERGLALAAARRHIDEATRPGQKPPSGVYVILFQTVMRLLGKNEEADRACRKVAEETLLPSEWGPQLLAYNAGRMKDPNDLLNAAGSSPMKLCDAHYYIGLRELADGHREKAGDHFNKAVETGGFYNGEYYWARAFLSRMQKDPNWPSWIDK